MNRRQPQRASSPLLGTPAELAAVGLGFVGDDQEYPHEKPQPGREDGEEHMQDMVRPLPLEGPGLLAGRAMAANDGKSHGSLADVRIGSGFGERR